MNDVKRFQNAKASLHVLIGQAAEVQMKRQLLLSNLDTLAEAEVFARLTTMETDLKDILAKCTALETSFLTPVEV